MSNHRFDHTNGSINSIHYGPAKISHPFSNGPYPLAVVDPFLQTCARPEWAFNNHNNTEAPTMLANLSQSLPVLPDPSLIPPGRTLF
jgi:hypothetical protein